MKEWQIQGLFLTQATGGLTAMSLPFGNVDTTFESFLRELPEDYRALTLEFKAFCRSRKIKTNYFVDRHSSGFIEGLNNRIKVVERRCYGILNRDHFFQRLFINRRGYELFV